MADDADHHATFLEYHGVAGATALCAEAVERILHSRRKLVTCTILTSRVRQHPEHALLLEDEIGDQVIVKSGFASDFGGAGPAGFSATLSLLDWHGVELEEVEVSPHLLERLDASAMTLGDVEAVRAARRVRPRRLWAYIQRRDEIAPHDGNPWSARELVVPLGIMDGRLAAAARDFWSDPDHALIRAHRDLEEAVREKAGISDEEAAAGPARIYATAFNKGGRLHWPGIGDGEQVGRANLFLGAVGAYRNPRAHRNLRDRADLALRELLLINHLFCLEAEAVRRQASPPAA